MPQHTHPLTPQVAGCCLGALMCTFLVPGVTTGARTPASCHPLLAPTNLACQAAAGTHKPCMPGRCWHPQTTHARPLLAPTNHACQAAAGTHRLRMPGRDLCHHATPPQLGLAACGQPGLATSPPGLPAGSHYVRIASLGIAGMGLGAPGTFAPAAGLSVGAIFGWEALLTFMLCSVVYGAAISKPGAAGRLPRTRCDAAAAAASRRLLQGCDCAQACLAC